MFLETTGLNGALLAVLFPPGNLAAEIAGLRRRLFFALGLPASLPFPCAAPLAWLSSESSEQDLAAISDRAARVYDGYVLESGYLFLAPAGSRETDSIQESEAVPGFPLPCGRGFPLAYFPESDPGGELPSGLPPPPRLTFRTFQAAALEIRRAEPWTAGLAWQTRLVVRYPGRILKRS